MADRFGSRQNRRDKSLDYSEMPRSSITWTAGFCVALLMVALPADAQIVEAVGERALGMGGAFVAVANDSSATWWNPAAQADGPFFDLSIGRAVTDQDKRLPAGRTRVSGFSLTTPVIGIGVYRVVAAGAIATAGGGADGRQDEEAPAELQAWRGTSIGASLVQTLVDGTHVGATLKYVRGRRAVGPAGPGLAFGDALDNAEDLEGGRTEGTFDLDVGALAVAGALRLGFVVRNLREPSFGDGAYVLPRQARVGMAIATEQIGGPPLTLSVDIDVMSYRIDQGARRMVAVGAEQWLAGRRLGLRAGARFNQVGAGERALTAGASVALRRGSFLEAHVVSGGTPGERGWGAGVRTSF